MTSGLETEWDYSGRKGRDGHTHTQPFYGPSSGTTRVRWCQKRTSEIYGARGD